MTGEVWALVLTAAVGHAVWNFAARKVAGDMVVLWLAFGVGMLALIPVCAYLWWQGQSPNLTWASGLCLLATGVLHAFYFALLGSAYEHGEISLVYPIARGSGIGLTAFIAWIGLGEEISPLGAGGIGLVFAGILCLGAPAFKRQSHGLKLALGVGLTIVCYSLVDKIGVGLMHPIYYITGMWIIGTLLRAPFVLREENVSLPATLRSSWPFILLIGLASMGTYLLILYAYTLGPISYIIAARESSIIIGAALGFIFLKERLTPCKTVGIITIAGGLALIKAS